MDRIVSPAQEVPGVLRKLHLPCSKNRFIDSQPFPKSSALPCARPVTLSLAPVRSNLFPTKESLLRWAKLIAQVYEVDPLVCPRRSAPILRTSCSMGRALEVSDRCSYPKCSKRKPRFFGSPSNPAGGGGGGDIPNHRIRHGGNRLAGNYGCHRMFSARPNDQYNRRDRLKARDIRGLRPLSSDSGRA